MVFEYIPNNVCSRKYTFDIDEDNIIRKCEIIGGCQGNLAGISKLIIGMNIDHVIERFEGTDCHQKGTSCPDQIAKALKSYKESK